MSTPQGPDRYGADRDPDHAGPPTWGTPPPGGWGGRPDDGPPTGAWDPATDEYADQDYGDRGYAAPGYGDQGYADPGYADTGYGGRRRAEDREGGWGAPADAPWGDRDPGTVGYADDPAFGAGGPGGRDPWSDTGETTAIAGDYLPGDEPWAPREEVRGPRRGPFGLGAAALAGVGVGAVLVIALLVALFWMPGYLRPLNLDPTALQQGVTQVLTQDYGLQVGAVQCPDGIDVSVGREFTCQALIDGEPVDVPIRVISDDGAYQVSRV